MLHYRVVEDIPGPGYLIAVHHAVWHSPTGELVDVTPLHDNPKHQPISQGGDVLLFLVDTNAQPIAVGVTVGPRPSSNSMRSMPMSASPPTSGNCRTPKTRLAAIFTQAAELAQNHE